MQRIASLYFGPSPLHGRGVFTAADLPAGALLEICPVLVLPPEELGMLQDSQLYQYYFLWGPKQDRPAIALGFGSLYNHAEQPNACFSVNYPDRTLSFRSLAAIAAGEEITVDYHAGKKEAVWFAAKKD